MKHLIFIVVVLALTIGCACKKQVCPVCPPCPPAQQIQCLPDPDRVLCYQPFNFQFEGRYQKLFVPTTCHPECVDGDQVRIPRCKVSK